MAILYVIIADILWAGEIIFTKKFFGNISPVLVAAFASFFATFFYIPTLVMVKEKISTKDIILFVIMGSFVYIVPQVLYVKGIQENKRAIATFLASLILFPFSLQSPVLLYSKKQLY